MKPVFRKVLVDRPTIKRKSMKNRKGKRRNPKKWEGGKYDKTYVR